MNETECAWIAGIIDGKGCIGIYRNGAKTKFRRPLLQVGNTDLRIISKLKELCGGITFECTRKDRPRSKRIWSWRLYGPSLFDLLKRIEPYSISKRGKITDLIARSNPLV